ncbi:Protein phosphatase 2C [compost metagenome]
MSRSIGDHAQRPAICSEAYITSFTIDPTKHQFIILACDGVWDVLKDHEAAQFVVDTWNQLPARIQEKEDYEKLSFVSAALRDFALALRSMDNISTMILKLNNIEQ